MAPRHLLHGYVECDKMLKREVAHSGAQGPHPHWIKSCIIKVDNSAYVFRQLQQIAGPKPPAPPSCAADALRIVRECVQAEGPKLRQELERLGAKTAMKRLGRRELRGFFLSLRAYDWYSPRDLESLKFPLELLVSYAEEYEGPGIAEITMPRIEEHFVYLRTRPQRYGDRDGANPR